jgi:HK97 family phage portal protein
MIVRTFEGLQALTSPAAPTWGASSGSLNLYGLNQAYGEIYRTQPNVRICVDFLSRNIAQCAIHAFRRVSDTDRVRLADHELVRWLGKPNPTTRRYRLIESLVADLGIYFNAYWLKVRYRGADGRAALGFVRLPPNEMQVKGALLPTHFEWTTPNGQVKPFPLSEVVYFNGYNPLNPIMGLSPLETLRRILAEEAAAGDHREAYWRNASRHEGVIERPATAKRWTTEQKADWREQWQARFAGAANAGLVPVLEDGMTFKNTSFSAKDSEYTLGGKLRREICAATYHIPQPLVGILEHATFSNIKEQHKHLYQDTLGPWFENITGEIEAQVLIECEDQTDVYTEFNIAAKMAGSFEEQAQALQLSTGRPWRTVNEARAIQNLPRKEDPQYDEIAAQQGGPSDASVHPSRPGPVPARPADDEADARVRADRVVQATRTRQQTRLARLPVVDRAAAFAADLDRWNRELAADLAAITGADETARAVATNRATLQQLEADDTRARLVALERHPVAVTRTFTRDPATGLVTTFTDTPLSERGAA